MSTLLRALEWLGARARWMLAAGAFAALLFQDLAAVLRPALPWFVGMIFALAMVRIDLPSALRSALRPGRLGVTLSVALLMSVVTPVVIWALAGLAGLPTEFLAPLVYTYVAPTIASAAGIAFIMGLDALFALEICIVTSLLAPVTGPFLVHLLLGEAVPLHAMDMAGRLALILLGGAAASMIARRLIGARVVAERRLVFDGLSALGMLVFIIPVFDGATQQIVDFPSHAAIVLLLAAIPNFTLQILAARLGGAFCSEETAGAIGITSGNRNVSLYLAVVPENALFSLYTALYQFPMYLTPLVMQRFLGRAKS